MTADKAEIERIFKRFDANGDGKISSSELGDALKQLGKAPEEVQRMMAQMDTDGDGSISLQEFSDFLHANTAFIQDFAKLLS
uniref:EF-hand domain-containing protein n=1 Tax=Nelumbo nucifera TaxID=4432 RepID=A0A822YLB6_NELNU|nr:TPA_asm: hypothetical protein HUJ06_010930 [Nelumbo nucifera]